MPDENRGITSPEPIEVLFWDSAGRLMKMSAAALQRSAWITLPDPTEVQVRIPDGRFVKVTYAACKGAFEMQIDIDVRSTTRSDAHFVLNQIFDLPDVRLVLEPSTPNSGMSWPGAWELLGFLLPKRTRIMVFEPGRNELLEDWLISRVQYTSRACRCWFFFCFTVRTVLLLADCWRALAADKSIQLIIGCAPEWVRRWWKT